MNKKTLLLLFVILIIAGFFRLYNLNKLPPGLYPDEAMNGNNALEAIATGNWKMFYPENNGREGLFINIQSLSVILFGNQPWALRGVSAIFGVLTVLGAYFLAKELFKNYSIPDYQISNNSQLSSNQIENYEKIALFSSFLLATSFWHINFSRIGFRAIMAPFFLTWSLYFFLKSLNEFRYYDFYKFRRNFSLSKNKYIFNATIGGLFFGLGFHSYIAYRAAPAIFFLILVFYAVKNKGFLDMKKLAIMFVSFSVAAIITVAPLGWYFTKHPQDFFGRTSQISVFSSPTPLKDLSLNILKTAGMFNFIGDKNWRHNYDSRPELFWPVGIIFLIGIFLGFYSLFKRIKIFSRQQNEKHKIINEQNFPFLILFSWMAVAALPIVISNEGLPHALRAILLIPPIFILAGFGGIWLYELIKNKINRYNKFQKIIINFVLILILSMMTYEAYDTYFIKWGQNPNTQGAFAQNYADMGNTFNALPRELPKYVIVNANGTDVRGIPMPSQTIMFITDTFTPEKQKEKNIFYVLPDKANEIIPGAYVIEMR
ncbi:MAG: hypothetical protein QMD86_01955 [Patescibacteria group bacterium]|nr:hypothetical protein [Patescibacteria group bacterium]